jgi:uncharacterized protein with HEPN domain
VPFKDPRLPLEDILENIERIRRFTAGMNEAAFAADEEKIFAVQYALLVISEAGHRLGDDADTLCPGVPWKDIRGIGNWLRHGYDKIDPHVIWQTLQKDLSPLQQAANAALQQLDAADRDRG